MDDTLLNRCTVALLEALLPNILPSLEQAANARKATAAVLEHLSAELVVMNQRNERLSVHEVARIFSAAATSKPI